MKGFKGFDKDLKCRDKQYEIGKEFTEECVPNLCYNGLHFCEFPLDVFNYYSPNFSRYAEVEATGEINGPEKDKDSKVCTNKLKICAEIGIPGIVSAAVEYVKEHIDVNKKQTVIEDSNKSSDDTEEGYQSAATNTGYQSAATNTGDYSAATNTGYQSAATNTGNYSAATNTGDYSAATNTGNYSAATNTGDRSAATNTGDYSAATNTGDYSAATNTGYQSAATNTGDYSAATTEGKNSVAISLGIKGIAKGSIGTWIVISEWEENGNGDIIRKDIKCFKVDGEKILPNTFYRLTDGEPEPIDVKDVDEYEEYCDNEE